MAVRSSGLLIAFLSPGVTDVELFNVMHIFISRYSTQPDDVLKDALVMLTNRYEQTPDGDSPLKACESFPDSAKSSKDNMQDLRQRMVDNVFAMTGKPMVCCLLLNYLT